MLLTVDKSPKAPRDNRYLTVIEGVYLYDSMRFRVQRMDIGVRLFSVRRAYASVLPMK
jgi:hypothetical protein